MSKSTIHIIVIVTLLLAGAASTLAQTVAPKQDEARLIAVVQSQDAPHKDKVDACRQLAIIGGKDSIAPLAALLGDEKLSHMARYALEPNPDPAVDAALRDALGKVKGGPLVGVIGSLGVRRDAKAVPALARLLNDADAVVARAAARALGKIGNAEAATALRKAVPNVSADRKVDFCEGLFRCAESLAVDGQRRQAVAIYDDLRKLDAPHQVRAGALRGAILTRQRNGLKLLQEHLRSDDYILFSAAVQVSQQMPNSRVTGMLVEEMKGLPADNQVLIIQALGLRRDKEAVPALLAAARSGPKPVRIAAIQATAEIGDASAVPVLVQMLDETDREIAQAAQTGLATLPGQEADAAVVAMFNSGNAGRQITALDLMGRRRMTSGIPVLWKTAGDANSQVRPAAIKAIGELGGPEQVPALLDLLGDVQKSEDLNAVEQALVAACTRAADAQTGRLISRFKQARPSQKAVLVRVLSAVGGADALQTILAAVKSDDAEVRSAAVRALGTWKTVDAAPHLLALARETSDPAERTLFLRGYLNLAARGELSMEQRVEMCRQAASMIQRDDEKKLLLGTLSNIQSPATVALIVPYLDDPGIRQEAAMAVVTIAERAFRGRGAARRAPELIAPLERVVETTANEDLAKRAKALLRQARSREQNN